MNLLFTATSYPPSTGGAQLLHHKTAQCLSVEHTVQVVSQWSNNRSDWLLGTTLNSPEHSENYAIDGIPVHQFGLTCSEKSKLIPSVIAYYPLMKFALPTISRCFQSHIHPFAQQADLIHNIRIGREGISHASFELARKLNIPFVFTTVHHPRWAGSWRYSEYIDLYRKADAVIALTNAEKSALTTLGVSAERIFVTGMGPILAASADPQQFLDKHKIKGPFVLFLGQHYPYKGFIHLLKATAEVLRKLPDTHFVFAGPSVKNSNKVFRSFSNTHIHHLGELTLQEKTDALAACALLCVPSTQESFGAVYTEAWSFAKPVIGCNIPAVSEVIKHDVNGYIVNQDSDEIAEAILLLLTNPENAKRMGVIGKEKVESHYNWNNLATLTESIYRSIV